MNFIQKHPLLATMRVHKPVGTLLLLWPTLWGILLAPQKLVYKTILALTLGAFWVRSAGCIINDYWDRHFDAEVTRTRERPLAAGILLPTAALRGFLICIMSAASMLLFLPPICFYLALCSIAWIVLYPLMKRIISMPQVFLGTAMNYGLFMGYSAQTHQAPWEYPSKVWIVYLASMFWTIGYDTIYALQDVQDDKKIGIGSTAILAERFPILWVGTCYAINFLILIPLISFTGMPLVFFMIWGISLIEQLYAMSRPTPVWGRIFERNMYAGFWLTGALGLS